MIHQPLFNFMNMLLVLSVRTRATGNCSETPSTVGPGQVTHLSPSVGGRDAGHIRGILYKMLQEHIKYEETTVQSSVKLFVCLIIKQFDRQTEHIYIYKPKLL